MYNDESNLESEIDKDLDKFTENSISIFDSSDKIMNNSKHFNNENINNKSNLKILLEDKINNYINKIDFKYKRFCVNNEMAKIKNKK